MANNNSKKFKIEIIYNIVIYTKKIKIGLFTKILLSDVLKKLFQKKKIFKS